MGRSICFEVPVRTHSLTNTRGHWTRKYGPAKAQRAATATAWVIAGKPSFRLPVRVSLTRIAPQRLDSDNLPASLKSIRDEIAKQLGVDDRRDDLVGWVYDQEKPKTPRTYAVRVMIEEIELSAGQLADELFGGAR